MRRLTLIVLLMPFWCAAAAVFAPGEQVWCNECREYADASHIEAHDGVSGFGYCGKCEGFFAGVKNSGHAHLGESSPRARPGGSPGELAPPGKGENGSSGELAPPERGGSGSPGKFAPPDASTGEGLADLMRKVPKWAWAAPAVLFGLFLLVSLLRHARPAKKRGFRFVDGVPQGITLRQGVLVCAEDGTFDGGTSQVYEALFNGGDRWEPAFVKRIIGAGMRSDQRFPMIEFEAGVLRRLEPTGAVPRVLVDPETVTLSDGSHWSYYAMSAAPGAPWPEHGGLGGDTRAALAALCEALMRLHALDIGHHDLKPQNIFWDPRRKRVTLLDFGSAIDHRSELVNPIGGTMTGTKPWIPPASDGKILADLSALSDNWVYGLLFCEALVGGVHAADRTMRRTPEKPADREWFRENLGRATSPAIADAVVDGLFALEKSRRMKLQEFLELLRREWEV